MQCERCHSPESWLVTDMPQRHAETRFPLLGAHVSAACQRCHINQQRNEFLRVPTDCYACHSADYQATLAPAHGPAGISTDCEACHALSDPRWGGTFDHARTSFPLMGAHQAVVCAECHQGNQFRGTPTQCIDCHRDDFNAAVDPAHASGGFSTACVPCHSTTAWRPAAFDHNLSGFPLTGAHAAVSCIECHANGRYAGTPTQCIDCHRDDFNATVDPSHTTGGFSTACVPCHSTSAWRPASFDHNLSSFPLTGAHLAVPCLQCHTNGRYAGTPNQCIDCHRDDFNATVDPSHAAGGFSTACVPCHSTTAWRPATFDHNISSFPLTGAHVTVPCVQCHTDGRYAGTPAQCSGCHQQEYNQSTNPAHAAAGFPQTCETCHSTTAWRPSSYNHEPLFPIASGSKHPPGRWNACADCHTVSTNFAQFTCLTCHEHSQSRMDPKHSERWQLPVRESVVSIVPSTREGRLMRTLWPCLLASYCFSSPGPALAAEGLSRIGTKVTYVSGTTIYLGCGRDGGLAVGDTATIMGTAGMKTAAVLTAVSASSASSRPLDLAAAVILATV